MPQLPKDQDAALDPRRGAGYGGSELPSEKDAVIRAFVRSARRAPADALSAAAPTSWIMLNAFAERMASLSVRSGDPADLRDGLLASALALARTDEPREVLPTLSLLHRSCELLHLDPHTEFGTAAATVPAPALSEFPDRSPADRSISAMGFQEGRDATGFRYLRDW